MFCVIYEFKIKPNLKEQFLESWSDFTKAIYRMNGSLGSRLHTTDDPGIYIAYAQWSSEVVFENAVPIEKYSKKEQLSRSKMVEATEEIKVLHKLNMIEDLLKQ